MNKHTSEPWEITVGFDRSTVSGGTSESGSAHVIADVRHSTAYRAGEGEANSRRIVACVNACAGINPEAVPDLLKLAKAMLLFYDELLADDAFTSEQDNYVNPLRAIIAKAEDCG